MVLLSPDDVQSFAKDSGSFNNQTTNLVIWNTHATLIRNPYITDPASKVLKQDWSKFEGVLADSWTVSGDGLVYTFKLKSGVQSQAGNELTADDVIWSFERHKFDSASAIPSFDTYLENVDSPFTKIDDQTLELRLKVAGAGTSILSLLGAPDSQIYDSTFLKEHATAEDPYAITWSKTNSGWGFGPYTIESHVAGESTVLAASPNYVFGEPAIKRIVINVVPEPGSRASAVANGDADLALDLLPSMMAGLGSEGIQTFPIATNTMINMPMVTTRSPFDNVDIRRAMAHAIPYAEIVENVFHGRAKPMHVILPADSTNYDGTGLDPLQYDPTQAKKILADAGIAMPVKVTLTANSASRDAMDTAILIQSYAKDAGFDVEVNQLAPAEFGSGRTGGSFQAFLDVDSANVMTPLYQLSLHFRKDSVINLSKWGTDEFYAAMKSAGSLDDPTSVEGMQAWNAVERIMRAELPTTFIAYLDSTDAARAGLKGYATRADGTVDLSIISFG